MRWIPLVLVCATAAAAPCRLIGRPWLSAPNPDAKLGETIDIEVSAKVRIGRRVRVLTGGAFGACDGLEVGWRRIEPRMQHVDTPAPNKDLAVYANAVVFGPAHGRWIGFDRIEYFETPLDAHALVLRVTDAQPSDERLLAVRPPTARALGVMRVAATVTLNGEERSSAPFRYTFRSGDDFLGWLSSFYNVPYLFGSTRSQVEQYLGADCADVLVAALRRAGWKRLQYSSVAGLAQTLHHTTSPVVVTPCKQGVCAPTSLRFGGEVQPGDLLALDYVGADADLPRAWDHIVALVEDHGPGGKPDGLLGPEDLVIDSGDSEGLKVAPLGEQGTVRVMVLRPR